MKFRLGAALAAIAVLFGQGCAAVPTKNYKIYLLEDASISQWCAYRSEEDWRVAVESKGAFVVGTLEYVNNRLVQVFVTETAESGDWTVYDRYSVDDHGNVIALARTTNLLGHDRSVLQTYSVPGRVRLTATTTVQLSTGKPLTSNSSVWMPDITIHTVTSAFPFAAILSQRDISTTDRLCVGRVGAR